MTATVLIERRRRTRALPVGRSRVFYMVDRYRLPLWDALALAVALWVRRRAFRIVRWTQRIESRAYARSEVV